MSPSAAGAGEARERGPFDVLVVGSGVAGLSAAVQLAARSPGPPLSVAVLTKGELAQSTTRWAQGGVAAVLGGDEDSTDLHLADTLAAGAGLCDTDAVRVLVDEGPGRVHELITLGVRFDREESGLLSLAREGGHSRARVVHAGGAATGAEVERALVEATRSTAAAVLERWFCLDLLVEDGACCGVRALAPDGRSVAVRAQHVMLTTGGAGQLFAVTTNPAEATGDGVAMALRAGVAVADIEFVQFHPTALHHPAMPRPLLSEALRGHGALLRDARGERFVDELAPRDVVSRAMAERMAAQGVDHLWLDATALERFALRFPTIARSLDAIGLDPGRDWLPIAPAAHHLSGGVITDLWGASSLPGLWAAGEAACSGVHGANRLASNSLLEGMVFGARVVERIGGGHRGPTVTGAMRAVGGPGGEPGGEPGSADVIGGTVVTLGVDPMVGAREEGGVSGRGSGPVTDWSKARDRLQQAMTAGAGVVRSARSLADAEAVLDELVALLAEDASGADAGEVTATGELSNLVTVGRALLRSGSDRCESRGAHNRADFGSADPRWRRRLVHGGAAR